MGALVAADTAVMAVAATAVAATAAVATAAAATAAAAATCRHTVRTKETFSQVNCKN